MRILQVLTAAVGVALFTPAMPGAQGQDADRSVAGGGITVPGWAGVVDAKAAAAGKSVKDSKFDKQGDGLHLAIGPAAYYYNPKNTVKGDYTVKGTFTEAKPSAKHPHPAGLFIGGANLGTAEQNLMYCVAYADGSFLVRRFNGATVTNVVPKTPNEAVKKVGADGGALTQEVAWVVKGDRAECLINGTSVAGFTKAEIVGADKLASTDGVWGIRVSHNVDLVVTNLGPSK